MIEQTFFELIQVAIGTRICLSHTLSADEWGELYAMAKKQSLVGVSFAGVQKLQTQRQEPPEMLYLTWMGMAAKIQQRNEVVNRQCVELQAKLSADGFDSCVLKGQGVASLYCENLRGLRQSGDIDVLMWKDGLSAKENKAAVIAYAKTMDPKARASEHHIAVNLYDDTEVEMHYAPAYLCNPFDNGKMQQWFWQYDRSKFPISVFGFRMPDEEYNLVFMLAHAYRHYLGEGLGMRQLMDYYFVLSTSNVKTQDLTHTVSSFNMLKFAGAVMWIMKSVFKLEDERLICPVDKKLGTALLSHVMQGGNFGHHNNDTLANPNTHFGRFANQVYSNIKLLRYYPSETIWAPIATIKNFIHLRLNN